MTDGMSESHYVQAFLTERPRDGIAMVKERQKQGKALDESLAQYFAERAMIELQYAKSLTKAANKLYVTDRTILGNFAPIWDKLSEELNELSTIHMAIARATSEEIEKPFRAAASPEIEKIKQLEPAMNQIAKEYDQGSNIKGSGSSKGSLFKRIGSVRNKRDASASLATWFDRGPAYLDAHQMLEESRLLRMKDLVEKFEQFQTNQLLRRMEISQSTMAAANSFNVIDEIQKFCTSESKPPRPLSTWQIDQGSVRPSYRSDIHSIPERSESVATDDNASNQQDLYRQSSPFPDQAHQRNSTAVTNGELSSQVASQHPSSTEGANLPTDGTSSPFHPFTWVNEPQNNEQDSHPFDRPSTQGGGHKLMIDIKQPDVNFENSANDPQATETLERMATLLREKSPTIVRRSPRGRRQQSRQSYPALSTQNDVSPSQTASLAALDETDIFGSTITASTGSEVNPFRKNSMDISTTTSINTISSSVSYNPSLASDAAGQRRLMPDRGHTRLFVCVTEELQPSPKSSPAPALATSNVSGTVQLVYKGTQPTGSSVQISINANAPMSSLVPESTNVTVLDQAHQVFVINDQVFDRARGTPVTCLRYASSMASPFPIRVSPPTWRCDENAAYMMVPYTIQDNYDPNQCQVAIRVLFDDVDVSNVQNKPAGLWNAATKTMSWGSEALVEHYKASVQQGAPAKILAIFKTENQARPKTIMVRYMCRGSLTGDTVSYLGSLIQVRQS